MSCGRPHTPGTWRWVFRRSWTIAALATGCADGPRRSVQTVEFNSPERALSHSFGAIGAIAEVDSTRVLVLDDVLHRVWMADFHADASEFIGTVGSGPMEYRSPSGLLAVSRDSILLDDWRNGRFGVFVGGVLQPTAVPRGDGTAGLMPSRTDGLGRMYSQEAFAGKDSIAITRWDWRNSRLDTAAFARVRDRSNISRTKEGDAEVLSAAFSEFPPVDVWGVFSDGTVVVARISNYDLDLFPPDGPPRLGLRRGRLGLTGILRNGMPFRSQRQAIRATWGRHPTVDPSDRFWVRRNVSGREQYDVWSRVPELVGRVVLPRDTRLIAFGNHGVYVAREGADGAERIERYADPVAGR
jgi:hypothetical protein